MAGVALGELQGLIMETLLAPAQSTLMNQFPGGVWPRLPQTGSGPSATPGAFYTLAENPAEAGKLKHTISVLDEGDVPAPDGAARNGYQGFPLVYAWLMVNQAGATALAALDDRLHSLFRRVHYPLDAGGSVEFVMLERQPLRDADDFGYPGRQFTIWRVQGTFVRQ